MSKPIAYRNPLTGRSFLWTPLIERNCGHLEPIFAEPEPAPAPEKKVVAKRKPVIRKATKGVNDVDS